MKKWNKFCYVFSSLSFFVPALKAQILNTPNFQAKPPVQVQYIGGHVITTIAWPESPTFSPKSKILQKNDNWRILPTDYYVLHQQAFFCRVEMKVDKLTPVWPFQIRVRVGSLQDNDWLEQKPGAIKPQ
ncbi:hypothetical protein EDB95_0781 [Dinghuibacter silviterrae]|uniref:Uncharacterized protein n=1 Tax=Dinghuibacter silviterrae TaxID=1539049 RepID=A0A4R8DRK2_9BACT|nr:hypothetical protein EDB95_0781 [Dinghuibacter silviterrae]